MHTSQPANRPRTSVIRRLAVVFLKVFFTLIIIVLILVFLVQTPYVQGVVRVKAEKYLSRKLNTTVGIGNLSIGFPNTVLLEHVYLQDRQKDTLLAAGLLHVDLNMWELLHNTLDIRELKIADLTVKVNRGADSVFNFQFVADAFASQDKNPAPKTGPAMKIYLRSVLLDRIRLVYKDAVTGNDAQAWIGHNRIRMDDFDPAGQHFSVSTLNLDSTNIQYDNDRIARQKKGMDFAHLNIAGLSIHGDKLYYTKDSIGGELTGVRLSERSGFELDQLQTKFLYSDKHAWLKDLLLRTPGSLIQRDLAIEYDSITAIAKDPARTRLDLDLRDSKVQLGDILAFVPSLATQPVFAHPADTWRISTRVQGSLALLRIGTFQFSGLQDLQTDLSGTIRNVTDTKRMNADLDIHHLSGSRKGLEAILPPHTLPSTITLPDQFAIHGKLAGGMDDVNTYLVIATSSGSLVLKGSMNQFREMHQAKYDLALQTKGLDLGLILQDRKDLGRVTADLRAKGTGLDLRSADAHLGGVLHAAMIRQYDYREFRFDGSIARQQVKLQSSIDNQAVSFNLQASADLSHKFPALNLDWQIDTLDMRALHLAKDTMAFKGHLLAAFADTDPDSLVGSLRLGQLVLVNGGQRMATDSIVLIADHKAGQEDIRLGSEMANLDWKGQYKITEVPEALKQTLDKYFHTTALAHDSSIAERKFSPTAGFTPQQWQMDLHLRVSPIVLAYMPSLKGTDSIAAQVSFNSDRNDLQLSLNAPRIQMGSQVFHRVTLQAGTKNDRLAYGLEMEGVTGSSYRLYRTSLDGYLANDRWIATVLLKDENNKDRYRVAAEMDKLADGLKVMLNPDSLLLNYDRWLVSRDNFLQFGKGGIEINDFKISQKDESLQVNSHPPAAGAPIDVSFSNFRLATLSRFANQDSLLVDGLLNGRAEVKNISSSPLFTSDLTIKELTYRSDTVGDLALKVNNAKANAYSADLSLSGHNSEVQVTGDYYTGEGRIDMKLDLKQLNLAALKPFTQTQIEDIKGYLRGSLAIAGTMDKPAVTGNLHFDSTLVTPLVSGEPLKLSNDNIEFDADGFNFSEFAFLDSAGNKATIDGNVYTKDYKNYNVDVTFNANNFRIVNAPEESNRLFYGQMNLDAAMNISGDPVNSLKVDGDVRVNKRTNFTVVLPGNNPEIADREGVIRFVDKAHPEDTLVRKIVMGAGPASPVIKGFDVSLTVETDSNAMFTMVIDERNGDALTARGRSNLVFGMDKSGKTDLTGAFEVESGAYNLSLDLLKRKFDIQHGSTITWTGDPTSATLDLNATYTANTPSIDLIANEVSGRPQTDIAKFNQKLPFQVTLKMEGELLKPKITFDITLPDDVLTLWPDVDQKLQQIRVEESELNKQVFALLLLNRFVGEDPLQSQAGGGSTLGNMAFQSASQILTNQLDQLAGSLIKGVDIHFDLNNQQDFSTGTEQDYTELNVSVSKKLFSDRVAVNVGSDFDVQGTGNRNQNASNLAGDLAVDYKLTPDGRYMLRAYRKNQYEAVVEGEVVETGVSFILTFDYDRFRELFGKTQEETLQARKIQKKAQTSPNTGTATPAGAAAPAGTVTPAGTGGGSNK